MKKWIALVLALALALSFTACSEKLVSDTCAFCGGESEKNYTSPQEIDVNISSEGRGAFTLKGNETVSLCKECYGIVELMNGKSA